MSERRIELTRRRPKTVAEVDRWLQAALDQRAHAVREPTPESAATVGRCDAAIDELLEQRFELTEAGGDPVGT